MSSGRIAALTAGGLSAVLGLLVIVGWHTHIAMLVQVHPTFVPMLYNTALGFVLCGAGILAAALGAGRLARLAGAVAGALGLLTLLEHLFGVDLGIDQLLMNHYITIHTPFPGRMAINTAINFTLSGAALLAGASAIAPRWAQAARGLLGSIVSAFGLIAFSGYLSGIEPAYAWWGWPPMAVQTSAGFVLVGAGLVGLGLSERRRNAGAPGWLTLQVMVGGMAATICLWQAMDVARQTQIQDGLQTRADAQAHLVHDWVQESFQELDRMAQRWTWQAGATGGDRDNDAKSLLTRSHGYASVQWLDAAGRARTTGSAEGGEPARALDLTAELPVRTALEKARVDRRPVASKSFDLGQGNRAFIIAAPLFIGDRLDGYVVGVFGVQAPFGPIPPPALRPYAITLVEDEKGIYDPPPAGGMRAEAPVEFEGISWTVRLEPTVAAREEMESSLPEWTLAIGVTVSILLAAVISLAQRARGRLRLAQAAEHRLSRVLDAANPMVVVDRAGRIEFINAQAERLFGYGRAELLGHSIEMLEPERLRDTSSRLREELYRDRKSPSMRSGRTLQGRRKDGSEIQVEIGLTPLDAQDHTSVLASIFEITDRERMEQQLRQLSRAVEQSPSTVVITSLTGEIEYVNPKFTEITGYALDEVLGKNPRLLKSGETPPEDYRRMWETITQGRAWHGEFHNRKKNGQLYRVSSSISPIVDGAGRMTHFVAVSEDITQRKEAEAALEEAGRVLQAIFDNIQDGVVVVDAETRRFALANKAFCRMLGYSSDEIPNLGVDDIHPPAELPRVARDLQAALASEATHANDVQVMRKDGSVFFADIQGARFELNSRVCLLGSFRDITERKIAQQGLADALAFNARLLTSAPVGILTYKPTGECVSCNDAAAEIVGGTVEQLKGQNFRTLESWKRSGLLHMAESVITTRRIQESDIHIVTTFGQERWLTARMSLFRSGDDELLLLIVNDVSMRKRAEGARERLVAILDATPDFVAIGDLEGRVLYLNSSGRRMLGLEADQDLSGLRMADGLSDWARRQTLEIGIPAAVRDGAWQGMSSFLDREGREIPFSQVILAHKAPDGQVAFLSTIMRDLGKQKSLEAQLQQSQKLEAVGRLAGGVAHDFNNLLTVITGYGEIMRREIPEGTPARPRLEEVIKAGERATALTRQLLAFSRKQVMQPRILDLNSVVHDLKKMLDRVVGEDVDIKAHTASNLGTIKADPTQIEQVIMNLAVNARDAMPKGGCLTIETANTELDETYAASHPPTVPGRFVMLTVSDTGVGMDAETQKRIFEPFFTTKPEGRGTGLGLATVYGIVKQSGGYVWVHSEVGRGTVFKIYLPRVDDARAVDGPAAAVVDGPRGGETVMVVEDMENVREMIREVLAERGYTVLSAASAEEALALVRERRGPIHLLLTDVVMPKLGGRGLAEQILALRPGTPVLYMSGYTNGAVTHGGALEEGIDLLEKPFSPARLAHAVRKALGPPKNS